MVTSVSNSGTDAAGSASSLINSAHRLSTADSAADKQDAAFNKAVSSAGSLSGGEATAISTLHDHWSSLPKNKDGYLSKEMLSSVSTDAKMPSNVRAAAQFLIDNPSTFNKVDIAFLAAQKGSDSPDNLISYQDLNTTLNASQNHSTPASTLSMPDASAASGATESGKVKTKTSTTTVTTADGTTTTTTKTEGSNAHDRPRAGGPAAAGNLDPAAKAKQVEQHLSDLMSSHGYKTIDDLEAAHPEVKDLYNPKDVDGSFEKVIQFLENLPVVDGPAAAGSLDPAAKAKQVEQHLSDLMSSHGYKTIDDLEAAHPEVKDLYNPKDVDGSFEKVIQFLENLPVDPSKVQPTPAGGSTPANGTTSTDSNTGDTATQAQKDQINYLMAVDGYANADEMLAANPSLAGMSVEDGIKYLQNLPVDPHVVRPNSI
jgi:hypothetical protein